jgi:hypothetical protein
MLFINSILSIEERSLLTSLQTNIKAECIKELEEMLKSTSENTEFFSIIYSLLDKLKNNSVNIISEREDLN